MESGWLASFLQNYYKNYLWSGDEEHASQNFTLLSFQSQLEDAALQLQLGRVGLLFQCWDLMYCNVFAAHASSNTPDVICWTSILMTSHSTELGSAGRERH